MTGTDGKSELEKAAHEWRRLDAERECAVADVESATAAVEQANKALDDAIARQIDLEAKVSAAAEDIIEAARGFPHGEIEVEIRPDGSTDIVSVRGHATLEEQAVTLDYGASAHYPPDEQTAATLAGVSGQGQAPEARRTGDDPLGLGGDLADLRFRGCYRMKDCGENWNCPTPMICGGHGCQRPIK